MLRDIIEQNEQVKVNSREVQLLREHFAGCFNNEGNFDLEKFRTLIGDEINIVEENQGFNFLGKSYARMLAGQESLTVIRPDEPHNSKPENRDSENIYISGDNLDALKHLCKSYAGQVKCIYIDPPYNTGSDGFVYNDKFDFKAEELSSKLGINLEQAAHIIDIKKSTSASDAAWLTFMLPRLELAKDMLSKDGVIFISIDDNEQANLKLLCDEIFGVENFIAQFIWISKTGGGSDNNAVVADHEYVLCYARSQGNGSAISKMLLESEELNLEDDYGPYRLGRELNKWGANSRREDRPTMFFPIPGPNGEDVYPIRNDNSEGCWRWGKTAMFDAVRNHNVEYSKRENGTYIVYEKIRSTDPRTKPYRTFLKDCGTTAEGTKQIKALFGSKVFDYPKPVELVRNLLEMSTEDGDLILDFFGGSSTTVQAVMELNCKEDAIRKYIIVQLQEKPQDKSEAAKAGYKTIDEVGMERIRRAAKKIAEANPLFKGDLGFKHYTLEDFDGDTIDRLYDFDMNAEMNDNDILSKFGAKTVLTTWLCRDGYGLNPKVTEVKLKDYTAYHCGQHLYLLDADFYQDEMAELIDKMADTTQLFTPDVIVVFGYGMGYSTRLMLDKNLRALADARGNKITLDVRY